MNTVGYILRWHRPSVPSSTVGRLPGDYDVGQITRSSREEIFRYLAAADWSPATIYEVRLERPRKRTLEARCMLPQLKAWSESRRLMPDDLYIELPVSRSTRVAEVMHLTTSAIDKAVAYKLIGRGLADDLELRLRTFFEKGA